MTLGADIKFHQFIATSNPGASQIKVTVIANVKSTLFAMQVWTR